MDGTAPERRWWRRIPVRLSVRALMVLVLISAVGAGWVVHRARVQRDAVAAIEKAGGKAYYDWQLTLVRSPDFEDLMPNKSGRSPWPKWLVDRVGPDYFDTVKLVIVTGPADAVMPHVGRLDRLEELDFFPSRKDPAYGPTDAGMVHVRGLTRLRHLKLGIESSKGVVGAKITGTGLAAVSGATKLQILELKGVPLSDPDLAALRGLTDLRVLEISSPDVTDAGLEHLVGLVEMRTLVLQDTRVTSAGIVHLRGMTRLRKLNLALTRVESLEACRPMASLTDLALARAPIVDAGLAPASDPGFAGLISLNLFQTRVGDGGLEHLRALPKLRRLVLTGTDITDAGVDGFKKARPDINLVYGTVPAKGSPAPAGR